MKRIKKHQETLETRWKVAKISFSRSSLDGTGHVTRYPDWPLRITWPPSNGSSTSGRAWLRVKGSCLPSGGGLVRKCAARRRWCGQQQQPVRQLFFLVSVDSSVLKCSLTSYGSCVIDHVDRLFSSFFFLFLLFPPFSFRCFQFFGRETPFFCSFRVCLFDQMKMEALTECQTTRWDVDSLTCPSPCQSNTTHISCLYPELLAIIFRFLDVRDRGRAAQVCVQWRDAAYHRSVWRNTEPKLHLRRANPSLFPSLARRGIRRVQILSLRRSLRDVISGLPAVESLDLSGCYNVTDIGIAHALTANVLSLTRLNLSLCKQITDSSLGRIAQHLPNLQDLDLGGCCNVTNAGLLLVAWGLKRLKSLNLRSCWHISDNGIASIAGLNAEAEGNLHLQHLGLQVKQKNQLKIFFKKWINSADFWRITGLPKVHGWIAETRVRGPQPVKVHQPELLRVNQRQRTQVPGQNAVTPRVEPALVRQRLGRRNGLPGGRRIAHHFAGRFVLRQNRRPGRRSRGPGPHPPQTTFTVGVSRVRRRARPIGSFAARPADAQHRPVQPHHRPIHSGKTQQHFQLSHTKLLQLTHMQIRPWPNICATCAASTSTDAPRSPPTDWSASWNFRSCPCSTWDCGTFGDVATPESLQIKNCQNVFFFGEKKERKQLPCPPGHRKVL